MPNIIFNIYTVYTYFGLELNFVFILTLKERKAQKLLIKLYIYIKSFLNAISI